MKKLLFGLVILASVSVNAAMLTCHLQLKKDGVEISRIDGPVEAMAADQKWGKLFKFENFQVVSVTSPNRTLIAVYEEKIAIQYQELGIPYWGGQVANAIDLRFGKYQVSGTCDTRRDIVIQHNSSPVMNDSSRYRLEKTPNAYIPPSVQYIEPIKNPYAPSTNQY